MGEWREALSSPTHARAERSLVAQTLSPDLFDHAKDLFGEANCSTTAMPITAEPNQRLTTSIRSISGRDAQAIFRRRRHQPRRPQPAKIRPGSPAPAMGAGTLTPSSEKAALNVGPVAGSGPTMSEPTRSQSGSNI
jgi:hypothetical protein